VTTGSKSFGPNPAAHDFATIGFTKTWNGGDGRRTTIGGFEATKWNDYVMSAASRLRPLNTWEVYSRYVGPPPSQPLWYDGPTMIGCSAYTNVDQNHAHWETNDQLALVSKLADKVKGHQVNLGVNLAEMREFVPMVTGNLLKLAKAMRALKHGDFATAARQLGARKKTSKLKATDISGRWLELQYGWLPSLSDIYEGSKAFEALSNGPRKSTVVVSRQKVNRFNASTSPSYMSAMATHKLKRYITYEMREELSAPRQIGLLDPLTVGWEILPFSFVVDWSLPIGTYLEALGVIPFLNGRFLQTTVSKLTGFEDVQWVLDPHGKWGPNWVTYVVPPFPTTDQFRGTEMSRVAMSSVEVPFPAFKGQGEIFNSAKRVFNAVGLLHQAFSSGTIQLPSKKVLRNLGKGFDYTE
jgi:hypothetical protein